ncbi:Nuclear protein 96, partial [Trinorchestia longiramus]
VGVEACLREVLWCSSASPSSTTSPSAPQLLPSRGRTLLHRLAATVQSSEDDTLRRHPLSSVFELCMALWGKLDYGWLEEAAASSAYVQARARVETVSQWLEGVCRDTVDRDVQAALEGDGEEAHLDAVFSRLTARQIQHACELLQNEGDHHLALLLAQVCMGDDSARQIVAKQLSNWAECSADATLSSSRLLLYVLAAGKATHTSSNGFVNVCKGLDWRRCLAVHLWYVCPSTCTVSEALADYERGAGLLKDAHTPSSPYCQEPVPQYLADHTLPDSASRISFDICYHLLKLYTDSAYRLDQLLNPAAITPDPLDVTASWLVMALIHSLGYDRVNPVVSNGLHLSMAAYLESVGLWHWAVFALLSLKEEKSRASEVRALLTRHVQILEGIEKEDETFTELHKQKLASHNVGGNDGVAISATRIANYSIEMTNTENREQDAAVDDDVGFVEGDDNSMDTDLSRRLLSRTPSAEVPPLDESIDDGETSFQEYGNLDSYAAREAFIVTHLKVPEKWINESKAILARSFDMIEEEAWYLIKANDLDAAHKLFVDTIAPNAIINENHKYLQRFITAFEASSDDLDVRVADWKVGGAVYAHYLHVLDLVDEIKASEQPFKDKVEALRPRLLALCSQLNSLRTPTAKHRLCVSEVSRVVVGVLRAVLGDDLAATTAVANQIASLPLSKDCALQELNTLTHQYLAAVAS